MKRLFVCNGADDCTTLACGCHWPHEPDATYLCEAEMDCGEHGKVRCIRCRNPHEVVILKEIARLLDIHRKAIIGSDRGVNAILDARKLWRLLKEGRKA